MKQVTIAVRVKVGQSQIVEHRFELKEELAQRFLEGKPITVDVGGYDNGQILQLQARG